MNIRPRLPHAGETLKPIADTDALYGAVLEYLLPSYHGEIIVGSKTFSTTDIANHLGHLAYDTSTKENTTALLGLLDSWGEYIPADMEQAYGLQGAWQSYGVPENARDEYFAYEYDRRSLTDYVESMWHAAPAPRKSPSLSRQIGAAVFIQEVVEMTREEVIKLTDNEQLVYDALQVRLLEDGLSMHDTIAMITEASLRARGDPPSAEDRKKAHQTASGIIKSLVKKKYIISTRYSDHRQLTLGQARPEAGKTIPVASKPERTAATAFDPTIAALIIRKVLDPTAKSYESFIPAKIVRAALEGGEIDREKVNPTVRALIDRGLLRQHTSKKQKDFRVTAGGKMHKNRLRTEVNAAGGLTAFANRLAAEIRNEWTAGRE